jgi:2-polyprenyl-3-methyl-5-hydroxy-6-metoxy-1,4-benzoquinol methylase
MIQELFGDIDYIVKDLKRTYKEITVWGKILVWIVIVFLLITAFKSEYMKIKRKKEAFDNMNKKKNLKSETKDKEKNLKRETNETNDKEKEEKEEGYKFTFKHNNDIYDDYYASIYDTLFYTNEKNDCEMYAIEENAHIKSDSKILDIGCGLGHHVAKLSAKGYDVLGVDQSKSMIRKAKELYPTADFEVMNITPSMGNDLFEPEEFSQILCLYFTIYYMNDRNTFFSQCNQWLKPGGYLVVHMVNRKNFDPIIPPGNPLIISAQKLAKKRITNTKIKLNDGSKYTSDFQLDESMNNAKFVETIKFPNGKMRKHKHILNMPQMKVISEEAKQNGFIVSSTFELKECGYDYQYLYFFQKK